MIIASFMSIVTRITELAAAVADIASTLTQHTAAMAGLTSAVQRLDAETIAIRSVVGSDFVDIGEPSNSSVNKVTDVTAKAETKAQVA